MLGVDDEHAVEGPHDARVWAEVHLGEPIQHVQKVFCVVQVRLRRIVRPARAHGRRAHTRSGGQAVPTRERSGGPATHAPAAPVAVDGGGDGRDLAEQPVDLLVANGLRAVEAEAVDRWVGVRVHRG